MGGSSGEAGSAGSTPAPSSCDPLPAPTGVVIQVDPSQAASLHEIVQNAASGATISLAPGTYAISQALRFGTGKVTLRSSNDDATSVTIDAAYSIPEAIAITASDVTVAHVTVMRAVDHPIHVYPPEAGVNVEGTNLYGLRIVDGGEQFLKVNPIQGQEGWVDKGVVACSLFLMTDEGRPHVESLGGSSCYTGGIDVHAGWGWTVRNNRFEGIYCDNGLLAEHAVHFWRKSRDTVVENNVIVNCGRGIGFGLGEDGGSRAYADAPYGGIDLGHIDGIIRNNVVFADRPCFDTGIELSNTRRPLVLHNTVVSTDAVTSFFSSIDYRWPNTDVLVQNNLTRRITLRNGAQGIVDHNLETTDLGLFVDAASVDLHLVGTASAAIDKGVVHQDSGTDIDGASRQSGAAPDIGADEYVP